VKNLQTVEPIQETLRLLLKETGVSWKEVPNELGQGDFLVEGTKILVAYQPLVRPADIPGLVYQLKGRISQESHPAYGVIAADFISDASRDRIRDEGLGTLDRSGNCSIRFDRVLIEVRGNPNQFRTPKENKALFAPKAQRVGQVPNSRRFARSALHGSRRSERLCSPRSGPRGIEKASASGTPGKFSRPGPPKIAGSSEHGSRNTPPSFLRMSFAASWSENTPKGR